MTEANTPQGGMNEAEVRKAAAERVHMVSPETVQQWLHEDACVLVDVRESHEYAQGHIAGSHLVPLSTLTKEKVLAVAEDGKKLVLQCRSANRCGTASLIMLYEGYAGELYRMQGGILNWLQKGLPVVL